MINDPRWTSSEKSNAENPIGRGLVRVALGMIAIVTVAYVTVELFELGIVNGLAATGAALVAYSVAATIFDWPRMTWHDAATILQILLKFVVAIVAIIMSAVIGILDALFG
jgi:hypothetical protein